MSRTRILIVALVIGVIGGCAPGQKSASTPRKAFLTVDFKPGQVLKYRFVSSRDTTVDWGPVRGNPNETKKNKSSESLEMIVAYTPVSVDPYGVSTIRADCLSAKVKRASESSRQPVFQDAAEGFAGKSWTFTVDAKGKMPDRSKFVEALRQAGQLAFRADKKNGLIKEPDMLFDVIAMQWFLWDSISSINNPARGVAVGDKWKSVLPAPTTRFMPVARDVNYTLEEMRAQDPNNRIAVIDSSYYLRLSTPAEWPVPYTEAFEMSGMFGFLREYKPDDLQGQGRELFNIDAGRTERYNQSYTMHVDASLPMGLGGVQPKIIIDQNSTMELLAIESAKPVEKKD